MEYKVAPSLLAADFTRLGEQVHEIEEAGAPYLHLDVMDGAFVPSISFGMPVLKSLRKVTNMTFDVHMMVEEPGRYVEDIKKAGADIITVHAEACTHLDRVVIMTVNPGFGGQKFIPYTLEKVKQVRAMCDAKGLNTDIQVDGGVSAANVREVLEAGANVFVAGSAVFGSEPAARVKEFNEIFKEYEK